MNRFFIIVTFIFCSTTTLIPSHAHALSLAETANSVITSAKNGVNKLSGWVTGKEKEKIITFTTTPVTPKGNVTITQCKGTITITTHKKNTFTGTAHAYGSEASVDATKVEKIVDDMGNLTLTSRIAPKNQIDKDKKNNIELPPLAHVDLTLTIPEHMVIALSEGTGVLSITDTYGKITIRQWTGPMTISNCHGALSIKKSSGATIVKNAYDTINIDLKNGFVRIENAEGAVKVHTATEGILCEQKSMTSESSLFLQTDNGDIVLAIPSKINADLTAQTSRGIVTSELPVTLAPSTMTIDKNTWKKNKGHIKGTIGDGATGENGSTITIESIKGSIAIVKY